MKNRIKKYDSGRQARSPHGSAYTLRPTQNEIYLGHCWRHALNLTKRQRTCTWRAPARSTCWSRGIDVGESGDDSSRWGSLDRESFVVQELAGLALVDHGQARQGRGVRPHRRVLDGRHGRRVENIPASRVRLPRIERHGRDAGDGLLRRPSFSSFARRSLRSGRSESSQSLSSQTAQCVMAAWTTGTSSAHQYHRSQALPVGGGGYSGLSAGVITHRRRAPRSSSPRRMRVPFRNRASLLQGAAGHSASPRSQSVDPS